MKKTNWPGRRASMALSTALILVGSSFAFSGTSGATPPTGLVSLDGSKFEIDTNANLKVDNTGWEDWASVDEMRQGELNTGSKDNSFGQGTKEDTADPVIVSGGIPPNKSDLKYFGTYQEGSSSNGFLNMFWSRVQDPSGTTNMDFEFNQNKCEYDDSVPPVETDESDCSLNGTTPARTNGDLLISYDLSKGGSYPTLWLRTWNGSTWGSAEDLTTSGDATGSINASAIAAADSDGLGPLSARTFGEAQVSLAAILDQSKCTTFGSAYLKSRASDSFTAALKDFIAPMSISLSNCASIDLTKVDDIDTPLEGAIFTLYHNAEVTDPDAFNDVADLAVEDDLTTVVTEGTCSTDSDGLCSFSNVAVGNYWVVETLTPDGYGTAADQMVEILSGDVSVPVTFEDPRLPGNISIHKQDEVDNPSTLVVEGNPLEGAIFTLYQDLAPFGGTRNTTVTDPDIDSSTDPEIQPTTCTTDAGGDCSFDSVPLGNYWVVETTTPTGYTTAPEQAVLLTGEADLDLTFVDARQFKVIVLVCQESNEELYSSSVTFDDSGTATTSLATLTTATEAEICGLTTGAVHLGVPTGDHSAAIDIP